MFTFADLLARAQDGRAMENIAAAYGLKRQDVDALARTLLPVFQIGLSNVLSRPGAPATLADLLDPATFGAAFEDARAAVSPGATEAGRMALERLFGSREAAKVVADQAAAITGVGSDVVSKVMPTMAATVLGGVGTSLKDTPMGEALRTWSGGIDPAAEPLAAMMAPFQGAMKAFMKGYAEGPEKPAGPAPDAGAQALGRMFEAGFELSEQNRRAFEQVLARFSRTE